MVVVGGLGFDGPQDYCMTGSEVAGGGGWGVGRGECHELGYGWQGLDDRVTEGNWGREG